MSIAIPPSIKTKKKQRVSEFQRTHRLLFLVLLGVAVGAVLLR
jgi:hypothetical protein